MELLGRKCHLLGKLAISSMEMAATIVRRNVLPAKCSKPGSTRVYRNIITVYKSLFHKLMAARLIMCKHWLFKRPPSILNVNSSNVVALYSSWNAANTSDDLKMNNKLYTAVKEGNLCRYSELKINSTDSLGNLRSSQFRQPFRIFSSGDGPRPKGLPPLMNFPPIVWPSLFKSMRNWILCKTVVTPYFDREFNLPDFIEGSKQAVEVVSNAISQGDWESLKALVVEEAISEIRNSISKFSVQQRLELAVHKDDIYFSFPYQVGVMFDDEKENEGIQNRFVEITMSYHVLLGLKELKEQNVSLPLNVGISPEYQHRICICNYRFIREFTKGKESESEWKVNIVNHFKPSDFVDS